MQADDKHIYREITSFRIDIIINTILVRITIKIACIYIKRHFWNCTLEISVDKLYIIYKHAYLY